MIEEKRISLQAGFALGLTLLTAAPGNGQLWVARYNGGGNDYAQAIAVDRDGSVIVTGGSDAGSRDFATVKYDSSGAQQWDARYNGPGNDEDGASAVAVDSAGNVCVTGPSIGSTGGYANWATIKYSASGVRQWVARYDSPWNGSDQPSALVVDPDGNVYVTGEDCGTYETFYDCATIKYSASGTQQWVARYNGPDSSWDGAHAIALDRSGNVYVAGGSGGDRSHIDFLTIKYNNSGVRQWIARSSQSDTSDDCLYAIAVDTAGGIYVTGGPYPGTSSGNDDFVTIKYNAAGAQQWVARYDGPSGGYDCAYAIAVDASGNAYVTGRSGGLGGCDYATVKYNAAGAEQWVARYNGTASGWDDAAAIGIDASGNVYVTGESWNSSSYDYATVKYDAAGVEQWVARYEGPAGGHDEAQAIAVDGGGKIYVTGCSDGSGTGADYTTIKYSSTGSVSEGPPLRCPSRTRLEICPNPSHGATSVRYTLGSDAFVSMRLFDATGRLVQDLVVSRQTAGSHAHRLDLHDTNPGAYLVELRTGSAAEIGRLTLVQQ